MLNEKYKPTYDRLVAIYPFRPSFVTPDQELKILTGIRDILFRAVVLLDRLSRRSDRDG